MILSLDLEQSISTIIKNIKRKMSSGRNGAEIKSVNRVIAKK